MPIARLPLAFSIQSRTASTAKDARLVNGMKEARSDKTEIIKRPGLTQRILTAIVGSLPSGQAQGIFSWNNYLIAAFNNNIYTIQGNNSSLLGTIQGTVLPIYYTSVNADAYLAFQNGSNLYTINKGTPPTFTGGVGLSGVVAAVTVNTGGGYYGYATPVTITVGTTTTINLANHGLVVGQGVSFRGTLPTGMVVDGLYQVGTVPTSGTFTINSAIINAGAGIAVTTSGTSSGVTLLASPTVTFAASPTGVTATGVAQIYNNQVSAIVITNGGTLYPSTPAITFSAPNGSLATTATATVNPLGILQGGDVWYVDIYNANAGLYISKAEVGSGGTGYTSAPAVTFSHSIYNTSFPAATGYATINSMGLVTAITISSGGQYAYIARSPNGQDVQAEPITVTIAAPTVVTATATAVMASSITGPFAPGLAYLDNTVYVMDTHANIYASHVDNPTLWYTASIQASSDPDMGQALYRHLNYLVAFGQWSIEFFYDAGTAPPASPLAVNQAAKLEMGCANGYTVAAAPQTLVWVGQSLTEGRAVYMLDGTSPVKVSTRYIEKYLNKMDLMTTPQNTTAYCITVSGHTLYVLTCKDVSMPITLVFDLDAQEWYQWTSQSGDTGVVNSGTETYFNKTFYNGNIEYTPGIILQGDTDGNIYQMSFDYTSDAGNNIYLRAVSPNGDSGTNKRKFYPRIEIIGDKVVGSAYVRHSDNDYATWSNYRPVTLSYDRPVLYQNGQARRRAWEIFVSDNIPVRLEAAELDIVIGETGEA